MKISVLTTLYYSESYIKAFYERTLDCIKKLQLDYEFVIVDDGSPDNALNVSIELAKLDENVKVVELSRNFGHHQALLTALSQANGDWMFMIDSDLEEEPELLLTYWNEIQNTNNIDVVYGIQQKRKGKFFERISGKVYYKLFSLISDINYPADTLTARLMHKDYVKAILKYQEKELDLWCLFQMAGFKQKAVNVTKLSKGTTTYTLSRKLKVAINTITSVSHKPLYFIFYIGLLMSIIAILYIFCVLFQYFAYDEKIQGWSSIAISIWAVGGIITFCIGIIAIYLAKMFSEIKQRPHSIIRKIHQLNKN